MLIEILDGIKGCFIYIKNPEYTSENTIIRSILQHPHKIYKEGEYTIIRTSKIFPTEVTDSLEMQLNSELEDKMRSVLQRIECKCNCTVIQNTSVLRLPADGWEELIDMWSCHDREFSHLTEQEMKPKKNGVLYSTLHLIIEKERAPNCIEIIKEENTKRSSEKYTKIFYNQIVTNISDEYFLFYYLYDILQTRQEIEISVNSKICNIRLVDITYTYNGHITDKPKFNLSLKLAYKKISTDEPHSVSLLNINKYYTEALADLLDKNSTGIEMNNRIISFISKI
ncbi:hypothetical protein NEIRO03_0251 [Nematocida sp. AWRm78]|nr:hypothetical protein NEIRO02_0252 [Nematocida sp. AWRm79]KAI5182587.1 hypothetical protein NEIRO03_0251 [Nematocida sp. AWRm78]